MAAVGPAGMTIATRVLLCLLLRPYRSGCVIEFKQRAIDTLDEIPATERAELFTALRQQIDELEQQFPAEAQQ